MKTRLGVDELGMECLKNLPSQETPGGDVPSKHESKQEVVAGERGMASPG